MGVLCVVTWQTCPEVAVSIPHCGFASRRILTGGLNIETKGKPDVAILSPGFSPAVPDEPVVHNAGGAEVGAVSNELDGVVELDVLVVRAAREDAAVVVLEGVGSHRDGEGTNLPMQTTFSQSNNNILFRLHWQCGP